MGYLFLTIANISGISKVAAMKDCGKECPGEHNSVRRVTLHACKRCNILFNGCAFQS